MLGHPGLVDRALEERGLDLGPLDPLLDVVDEDVGEVVDVAVGEALGDEGVVLAVDARAHHQLDPGRFDHPLSQPDVTVEVHAGRLDDRLDTVLHRPLHL
jgi:hypothetical protein